MARYVMIVQSKPKDGRDADYNQWYDTVHLDDILAIPGVTAGRRLEATGIAMPAPGLPYLSLYEIEADDPATVMADLGARAEDGRMRQSDSYDIGDTVLWIYKVREPAG